MTNRVIREVGIRPDSLLLHVAGLCGVRPADEPQLLAQGYELTGLTAEGSKATFVYEREPAILDKPTT